MTTDETSRVPTYPWQELADQIALSGKTQAWLAGQVGCSPQAVAQWLSRETTPTAANITAIARAVANHRGDPSALPHYRNRLMDSLSEKEGSDG